MQLTGSEDVTADSSLNAVPADDLPESSVNDGETNVTGLYVGRDNDETDHAHRRRTDPPR